MCGNMATICQIGFSKELYLDNTTYLGSPVSTYIPTKFSENILIWGRYMLPKRQQVACMVQCRHLPNWIFEETMFRSFHTLTELITYTPTKFRENILFGGRDMPPKRNSKQALELAAEFYFQFHFDKCLLSGTLICIIQ